MQDVGVMLNMLGLEKHAAALRRGGFTTSGDVVDDLEGACALMSGGRKDKDTLRGYMSMRAGQPKEEVELAERRAAAFSMVRGALDDLNRLQQRKAQLSSSVGKGRSSAVPGQGLPKDAEDLLDKLDDAKERLKAAQQELATLAEMGSAAAHKRRPSTASSAASSRRRPSSASAGSTSPRVANEGRAADRKMPKMGATSFSTSHPHTPPPIKKGPVPEWGDAPYLDSFRANRPQSASTTRPASASRSTPANTTSTSTPPTWGMPAQSIPRRVDPNNWGRNTPISRVDYLNRMYKPRMMVNPRVPRGDLGGLEVVGAKANAISLGMEMSRNENAQMFGGATSGAAL